MSGYKGSIPYGRHDIAFDVVFGNRRTMEISVHPDGRVVVRAPDGATPEAVERMLLRRAGWIKKQMDYFSQFDPRTPSRSYIGGETHLYLGRQFRLRLQAGDTNEVKLARGFFQITCKGAVEPEQVKKLLDGWYLEKARARFSDSLTRCFVAFERMGLDRPGMKVRRMRTRWGSLSGKGTLTLNVDLIRTPRECIDYMITHELCHLQHRNHGPKFYRLLEQVMPDWEKRKHKLESALV
jgi:predicted metal-dependent hydrolase